MKLAKLMSVAALLVAFGPMAATSMAKGREPGSLLIYPYYSNVASVTFVSITNTKKDPSFNPQTNLNSVVDVHFIYIDGDYWTETNRFERLTPNDQSTFITGIHNPNAERGFLYCVALSPVTQEPISFNWLVGDEIVVDGQKALVFSLTAIPFDAIPAEGQPTDVDADGLLDLDGVEYEKVANKMLMSSFLGQGNIQSTLILVSLVGSSGYQSTIDFRVYNNNEQEFSATYKFRCWACVRLTDIDNVFSDAFLATTNKDPNAHLNGIIETGWARLDGDKAVDIIGNAPAIQDPPFVGALVQLVFLGNLLQESKDTNPTNGVLDSLQ